MTTFSIPESSGKNADLEKAIVRGIGAMITAWGNLATDLDSKIGEIRNAFGDARTIGGRTRPTMSRLVSELRAVVSQRDRRNSTCLIEIAEIERAVQRLDRFRLLVVDGYHHIGKDDSFECRDQKNSAVQVPLAELEERTQELRTLRERLGAI